MDTDTAKHTCLKIQLRDGEPIFVKGTWFDSRFELAITNGQDAWLCHPSGDEVKDRAAQWDQPVSEYVALAERYLGFQQPCSVYGFADAGDGSKRLSWTFEKEGVMLQWRWKCQLSTDCKKTTAEILDFLMDSNIRLSSLVWVVRSLNQNQHRRYTLLVLLDAAYTLDKEEVVRKTQSFERLKVEADKCLNQSEKISNEKMEFESALYSKFVRVLNSKKAKLRELRDKLSKQGSAGKLPEEEEESTEKSESFDEESDDDKINKEESFKDTATSRDHPSGKSRGRKRKSGK